MKKQKTKEQVGIERKKVLKGIFIVLLGILFLNISSANIQDNIKSQLSNNQIQFTETECSSMQYKILKPFLKDFTFEIESFNTKEDFFVILRQKKCNWYFEVLEEKELKTDIKIIGSSLNNSLFIEETEQKSIRGKFIWSLIEDEI